MLSEAVPFAMTIQFKMLFLSALTLIFISIGICAFPVKRALKMKVSDALRE
jgi:ABC-type antimicrobial peptide transport system permease subunit